MTVRTDTGRILYTLGYSGWNPEELRATAERLDALVVDVRFYPNSRNPSFRKGTLEQLLGERYLHLKPCGNKNFRNQREGIVLADEADCLRVLEQLAKQQPLILLCACKRHEECHRSLLATLLAERAGLGVEHLYPASTKQ